MAFDQARFKALADRLLKNNSMGVVTIEKVVETPAANDWDQATISSTAVPVDAIVFGVSEKLVKGDVVATDLVVTMSVPAEYEVGAILSIDGKPVTTVKVIPIPAAGEPVMLKIIVR